MAEVRSLHRKLAQVMYEADRIPKNGTAPAAMGGFKFVQVGDAADVIRKALAEQKISMIPTAIEIVGETEHPTSSGKLMTTLTVRTTWTLTDGDSGESIDIQSLGSGADMGDKAAPKAQSNAMKYALLMGFLLSTGDDPEQTDTSDRQRAIPGTGAPPDAKQYENARPAPAHLPPRDDSLIGTAAAAVNPYDLELRTGPDGPVIGFALKEGRSQVRVIATGALAEQIAAFREAVEGKRLTCYGTMTPQTYTVNKGKPDERDIPYTELRCTSLTGPEGLALPMTDESRPPIDAEDAELAALKF